MGRQWDGFVPERAAYPSPSFNSDALAIKGDGCAARSGAKPAHCLLTAHTLCYLFPATPGYQLVYTKADEICTVVCMDDANRNPQF